MIKTRIKPIPFDATVSALLTACHLPVEDLNGNSSCGQPVTALAAIRASKPWSACAAPLRTVRASPLRTRP